LRCAVIVTIGFIAFCLITSAVYIINDIRDVEKDRIHTKKKNRSLANGSIEIPAAMFFAVFFFLLSGGLIATLTIWRNVSCWAAVFAGLYFIINCAYSMGLKNIPLVEIFFIAAGFILRVLFGGALVGVEISPWLLLTVISAALSMSSGKRRNEIMIERKETRGVNKSYSEIFLDKIMYMFFTLIIVFYSLWCIEYHEVYRGIIWSVPIVMIAILKYCMLIEPNKNHEESDGDPTDVLLSDKFLLFIVFFFIAYVLAVIYVPWENLLFL